MRTGRHRRWREIAALAFLAGCAKPSTRQSEICTKENLDERVAVLGYLKVAKFTVSQPGFFDVELVEKSSDEEGIRTELKVGIGPNQIEPLNEKFKDSEVKVRTHDGKLHGYADPGASRDHGGYRRSAAQRRPAPRQGRGIPRHRQAEGTPTPASNSSNGLTDGMTDPGETDTSMGFCANRTSGGSVLPSVVSTQSTF